MNITIIGSRGFRDYGALCAYMDELYVANELTSADCVVSGGASGADELGVRWAESRGLRTNVIKAQWNAGRQAGNVVDLADLVVAFWDGKSRGTLDSLQKCRASFTPYRIVVT